MKMQLDFMIEHATQPFDQASRLVVGHTDAHDLVEAGSGGYTPASAEWSANLRVGRYASTNGWFYSNYLNQGVP